MILNDIERAVICGKQEYRTNSDFIDAIEAAVIAKLCAGVEMPEPCIYEGDTSPMYDAPTGYALGQLTTAIAAARVKAYDECTKLCDPDALGLEQGDDCATGVYRVEKAIRALKGGAA